MGPEIRNTHRFACTHNYTRRLQCRSFISVMEVEAIYDSSMS